MRPECRHWWKRRSAAECLLSACLGTCLTAKAVLIEPFALAQPFNQSASSVFWEGFSSCLAANEDMVWVRFQERAWGKPLPGLMRYVGVGAERAHWSQCGWKEQGNNEMDKTHISHFSVLGNGLIQPEGKRMLGSASGRDAGCLKRQCPSRCCSPLAWPNLESPYPSTRRPLSWRGRGRCADHRREGRRVEEQEGGEGG